MSHSEKYSFATSPRKLWFLTTVSFGVALFATQAVSAVETEKDSNTGAQVEEIIVTAQARRENLQKVPISAQVLSGAELAQQNVNTLTSITATDPSVHIGGAGRSTLIMIRGIGSGQNQAFAQSVGVFIDDIYYPRSNMTALTFLDLERVEILKGPQSTFFGNNAIAGAFNIITRKPTDTFEASVRALYGSYGEYATEGVINGPLTDTLSARLAVIATGTQGWITNTPSGKKYPLDDALAGRLTVAFRPTADFDATLKVQGSVDHQEGFLDVQTYNCPPSAPFTAAGFCALNLALHQPTGLDVNANSSSPGEGTRTKLGETVLTANYRKWGDTFTSVTGYYNFHNESRLDADFAPETLLNVYVPERYNQLSQEFRVTSPEGGRIEYVAGAYFQLGNLAYTQDSTYFFLSPTISASPALSSLVPYLPLALDTKANQKEEVYAFFGALTWNVTDKFKLTGGLRQTTDHQSFEVNTLLGTGTQSWGGVVPLPANLQSLAGAVGIGEPIAAVESRTDNALQPSAIMQYEITPKVMIYASYARGFKAGGFNGLDLTGDPSSIPFAPEHVNAYEMGIKSRLFDNRLRLNFDMFRSDYSDLQVSQSMVTPQGGLIAVVSNAAASRTQGAELEAEFAVTDDFRLTTNVAYDEAKFVDYKGVSLTAAQTRNLGLCLAAHPPATAAAPGPFCTPLATQDLSGRPTPFAPLWSGNLTAIYDLHLPHDYLLTAQLTGSFSSHYYMSDFVDEPLDVQPSYTRLDGRLTLMRTSERWAVDLIGKNLTNTIIKTLANNLGLSPGSNIAAKEEPRSIAVQLRYYW